MSDAICCGAAHLRSSRAVAPALLRAAHLGSAAMSHADMAGTASLVPLRPTTIFLRAMRFAAVLRTSRAVALALLRAAHLGFAAMSHADMAGTASLVPAMSRRSPNAHKKRHPGTDASIRPECLFCERMAHCYAHYLFENCGARLAALRPYCAKIALGNP